MSYPIEPGSDLDKAIDLMVQQAQGAVPGGLIDSFRLIDPWNPAHMLALGTRIHMGVLGVDDLNNVVAGLHAQWYGQPTENNA